MINPWSIIYMSNIDWNQLPFPSPTVPLIQSKDFVYLFVWTVKCPINKNASKMFLFGIFRFGRWYIQEWTLLIECAKIKYHKVAVERLLIQSNLSCASCRNSKSPNSLTVFFFFCKRQLCGKRPGKLMGFISTGQRSY